MVVNKLWIDEREIEKRIERVRETYASDPLVRKIEYRIGEDWTDEPAIFIEVHLADPGIPLKEIGERGARLSLDIRHAVAADDFGLHSSVSFVGSKPIVK